MSSDNKLAENGGDIEKKAATPPNGRVRRVDDDEESERIDRENDWRMDGRNWSHGKPRW